LGVGASTQLHAAAVRLVAELPDDATDLTPVQLDAIADLFEEIADCLDQSTTEIDGMLNLASQRGHQTGEAPYDYLTAAERAKFDIDDQHALDASLAHETLTRWKEAAGL
jgi:hypothetical protein